MYGELFQFKVLKQTNIDKLLIIEFKKSPHIFTVWTVGSSDTNVGSMIQNLWVMKGSIVIHKSQILQNEIDILPGRWKER